MIETVLSALAPSPAHAVAALAAFVAGVVRGFSGFGTAMIFVPMASAALSPVFAICAMQIMDTAPSLPLLVRAVRNTDWRNIVPLLASAMFAVPAGVFALKIVDAVYLRWAICAMILVLVAVLWSGWRMSRAPRRHETVGIGLLAGLLSGSAGMAGPPVILFYLSGQAKPLQVRANLIVFLAAMTVITTSALVWNGLFTVNAALWGIALMLPYGLGILIGVRQFGKSSERLFRRVAFVIILTTAVVSLPLFDPLFR